MTITVVQVLSCIWLLVTPWTTALQASLSFSIFQSLLKFMFIESMMPSNHLILCGPSSPALNLSQHQGLFQWQVLNIFNIISAEKVLTFETRVSCLRSSFHTQSDWFPWEFESTCTTLLRCCGSQILHLLWSVEIKWWVQQLQQHY